MKRVLERDQRKKVEKRVCALKKLFIEGERKSRYDDTFLTEREIQLDDETVERDLTCKRLERRREEENIDDAMEYWVSPRV